MSARRASGDAQLLEALFRIRGHHLAAFELYERGRAADALLMAMRPVTDVLPWLENRMRAYPEPLSDLTAVLATVGAALRSPKPSRRTRRAFERASEVIARTAELLMREAGDKQAVVASALSALLERAGDRYGKGLQTEALAAYQESYGLVRASAELGEELRLSETSPSAAAALSLLQNALAAPEPPPLLLPDAEFRRAVSEARADLEARLGASLDPVDGASAALATTDRLLDDVAAAYGEGAVALAARVAAGLYLQTYREAQAWLASAAPAVERDLTALLARDLRIAINDRRPGSEVRALIDRAHALVAESRLVTT